MSDAMPKCRLCGAAPARCNGGEFATCPTSDCRMYTPVLTLDEWRRLHGGLSERHLRTLRDMLNISGLTGPEVEALRACVGGAQCP